VTDLLADARTAIAAASTTANDVATLYLAVARARLSAASIEIADLDRVLTALEERAANPKQLSL
jgi:hypothetical protein